MTDQSNPPKDGKSKRRARPKSPSASPYQQAPYAIGKGKPPPQHQFKKGGKPGPGRPKGSSNKSDLDKVLDELVVVGEDRLGRPIRKQGRRVANLQLRNKAMQGDLYAIRIIKDHEVKMASVRARQGDAPPTAAEIRKKLEQEQQTQTLTQELADRLNWMAQMKRNGLLGNPDNAPDLSSFVYEALRYYREKQGWPRDPGVGEPWDRSVLGSEDPGTDWSG